MLRLPLTTELGAATAVAAQAGLGPVEPVLLHVGNHTTVRLKPWPIVARIASGTSFDFSDDSIARELTVAIHLARRDAPAVRATTAPSPGPYMEQDCAISLWEFVEGRPADTKEDQFLAAASLRSIHLALADVKTDLPSFITKVESCETILANPVEAPKLAKDDRLFLEHRYAVLREKLNGVGGRWQPLHGDTHRDNVLIGESGAIWMDLEAACLGPLEWDVVNLPPATWPEFGTLDAALLRLFAEVRSLCIAVWCWAEFDRSPAAAEAAKHHLQKLRTRFV